MMSAVFVRTCDELARGPITLATICKCFVDWTNTNSAHGLILKLSALKETNQKQHDCAFPLHVVILVKEKLWKRY